MIRLLSAKQHWIRPKPKEHQWFKTADHWNQEAFQEAFNHHLLPLEHSLTQAWLSIWTRCRNPVAKIVKKASNTILTMN